MNKRSPRKAPSPLQRRKAKERAEVVEEGTAVPKEMSKEDIYLYYQAVSAAKDRIAAKIELIERTENDDSSYFDADLRYDDRDKMIEELQLSVAGDTEGVHVDDIRQSLRDMSRWFETTIKNTNSFLEMIEQEKEGLRPKDGEEGEGNGRADEIIMGNGEYNAGLVERTIDELKAMSDASIKQDYFSGVWNKLYKAKGLYESAVDDFMKDMRGRIGEEIADVREREKIVDTQLAYLKQEKRSIDKAAATEREVKKIIEGKYQPALLEMEHTIESKLQEIEALEELLEAGTEDLKKLGDMRLELETKQAAADPFVRKRGKELVCEMLDLLYRKELEAAERIQSRIEEEEAKIAAGLAREEALKREIVDVVMKREAADREIEDARLKCTEERVRFREVVVKVREEAMVLAKQVRMLDDIVQEGQRVQKRHRFMERRRQQLRSGHKPGLGAGLSLDERYAQQSRAEKEQYSSDDEPDEDLVDIDLVARTLMSGAGDVAASPPAERMWPNPGSRGDNPGSRGGLSQSNEYLDMSIFREGAPERRPKEVVVESVVKKPVLSCVCTAAYAVGQTAQKSRMAKLLMKRKRRNAVVKDTMAAITFKLSEAFVVLERVFQAMTAESCMSPDLAAALRKKLAFLRREYNMLSSKGPSALTTDMAEVESGVKSVCFLTIQNIIATSPKQLLIANRGKLVSSVLLHVFMVVAVLQSAMEAPPHPLTARLVEADEHAMEVLSCNMLSLLAGDVAGNYRNPTLLLDSLRFFIQNYLTCLAASVGEGSGLLHLLGRISALSYGDAAGALRSPYDLQQYIHKKLESASDGPFTSSSSKGGEFGPSHRDALQALEVVLFLSTHPLCAQRGPEDMQKMAVELMARGAFLFHADVKDSFVEYQDPVPIGNFAALQELVYPPLLPAIVALDLFRRLMEEEISRARFVGKIGKVESLLDLQYLNVSLPQEAVNVPKPAAAGVAAAPPPTTERLEDMRDVHNQWVEDIAAILNNKIKDLHNILHGVFEGSDLVVTHCNLSASLRDKLSGHAEYLYRFTSQRSGSSKAAVLQGQPQYEECMAGIQRDRARIVRVLEAILHPWERKQQLLQEQYTKLMQLKSERMGDADAVQAQIDKINSVTAVLEKEFAGYKRSKGLSEEATRILNPNPDENEQIKYLKFESFNYQKTYRELKRELSGKKTELENLNSQKKLLLDMLLMYKGEQKAAEARDEGAYLPRQHHEFTHPEPEEESEEVLSPAPLSSSFQPRTVKWHRPRPQWARRAEPPKKRLSVLGPNTFTLMTSTRAAAQEKQEERLEQELLLPTGPKRKAKRGLAFVGDQEYSLAADTADADGESYWFDEGAAGEEEEPSQDDFASAEVADSLLKIVTGMQGGPEPAPARGEDAPDRAPFPAKLIPNALPMQVTVTIRPRAVGSGEGGAAGHRGGRRDEGGVRPIAGGPTAAADYGADDQGSVEEDRTDVDLEQYLKARPSPAPPHPHDVVPARAEQGSTVGMLQLHQAKKYGLVRASIPKKVDNVHHLLRPKAPAVEVWNFSHPTERSIIRVSEFIRNESESVQAVRHSKAASGYALDVPRQTFEACAPPPRGREAAAALLQEDLVEAFGRINQLDLLQRDRLLLMTKPHQPAGAQSSKQQSSPTRSRYKDKEGLGSSY